MKSPVVAAKLSPSKLKLVDHHVEKLGLKTRAEFVMFAIDRALFELPTDMKRAHTAARNLLAHHSGEELAELVRTHRVTVFAALNAANAVNADETIISSNKKIKKRIAELVAEAQQIGVTEDELRRALRPGD
jgi:hypothetical protein